MNRNPNDRTNEHGEERGGRGASVTRLADRVRVVDAAEQAALERVWSGLELPPPSAAPPGFARRVAALAAERNERPAATGWWAPRWAGAVALAAGIALGALLSAGLGVEAPEAVDAEAEESLADATLAALYLDAVDEDPAGPSGPGPDDAPAEVP